MCLADGYTNPPNLQSTSQTSSTEYLDSITFAFGPGLAAIKNLLFLFEE
jgi:hypothetical protein